MGKLRKCACGCGQSFYPLRMGQKAYSVECAIKIAKKCREKKKAQEAKAERKQIRERKDELRPIQYWLKRAEKAVNAYVRARDLAAGHGCITCGTYDAEEWHAGHYRSVGACSSMRYDPANIHLQCRQCNYFGAGKQQEYGDRLVARIGQAEVDRIKSAPKRYDWTREECQAIEAEFKYKLKELQK